MIRRFSPPYETYLAGGEIQFSNKLVCSAVVLVVTMSAARTAFGSAYRWIRRSLGLSSTELRKQPDPATGALRIYIERPGLIAKLWFEQAGPNTFEVHHSGAEADFLATPVPGEPIHVSEAREALHELGLDIRSCSWQDLLEHAE